MSVMLTKAYFPGDVAAYSGGQPAWYTPYIGTASQHSLLEGTAFPVSGPEGPMTRFDMAQAMYNTMQAAGAALPSASQQAEAQGRIGDWSSIPAQYQRAVSSMVALKLLSGVDAQGTFNGSARMTRAQAATVMVAMTDLVPAK